MFRLMLLPAMALAACAAWSHGTEHAPAAAIQKEAVVPVPVRTATRNPRDYFGESVLLTQDGRKVRFYDDVLKDRVVVVNVMYTTCKDACPLITASLNQVREQLGELFGSRVFFVSISSDPERDTPRALKKFAQAQHADLEGWTFLTGSKDDVSHVLAKLGQLSQGAEDHSTVLLVMDVDGRRMRKMLANVPPLLITEHVKRIAAK